MPDFWTKHLEAGERLLWQGRPDRGKKKAFHTWPFQAIALVFVGMSIWVLFFKDESDYALSNHGRYIVAYYASWVGLPLFAALAIAPKISRYFFRLKNLRYALTSRRAIITNAKGKILLYWVLEKKHLPWLEPDAVIFGRRKWRRKRPHYTGFSGKKFSDLSGFEMVSDAEKVFDLSMKVIEELDP